MDEKSYDLNELSELSGFPARTIRYYIHKRLIPRPEGKGPNSRYGFEHLAKLAVIRRLQDEGLALEAIGRVVEALDPLSIQRASFVNPGATLRNPHPSDASLAQDYAAMLKVESPPEAYTAPVFNVGEAGPRHSYGAGPRRLGQRSNWEHITITNCIELHVRRPLPSSQRKGLQRLLEAAKGAFGEGGEAEN
jgi:DNA-binding transcriptional MerR regulator